MLQVPPKEIILKSIPQVNAVVKINESLGYRKAPRTDIHERSREHRALPLLQEHQQEAQDNVKVHSEHERKAVPQDIKL
jgi:hypothetical protein